MFHLGAGRHDTGAFGESMDSLASQKRRRFLTVTKNAVMGEDLRELLMSTGDAEADTHLDMSDEWGAGYAVAFFDTPPGAMVDDQRVRALSNAGTAIVVLAGNPPNGPEYDVPFQWLAQPFRTDDVIDLLRRIGLPI